MSFFQPPPAPQDPTNPRPGPGCPWHELRETYGEPNINWCERNVCGWVEQPATAWTNLSYLILGMIAILQAKKSLENFKVVAIGMTIVFTGLVSFWYHASNNWLSQIFDFLGMYTYSSLLILLNLERLHQLGDKIGVFLKGARFWGVYAALVGINVGVLFLFHYVLGTKIQWTFFINILTLLFLERRIRKQHSGYSLKYFYGTLVAITFAQLCSLADVNRVYCEPENLFFHGHAMWHCLGGVASYLSYRFYRQFKFA